MVEMLVSQWSLKGKLGKGSITFRRGSPVDLLARFTKNGISIEVEKMISYCVKRSRRSLIVHEVCPIDIWLFTPDLTEKAVEGRRDDRQKCLDEVHRVIMLKQTDMQDVSFSFPQGERFHEKGLDDNPPNLRVHIEVMCKYRRKKAD